MSNPPDMPDPAGPPAAGAAPSSPSAVALMRTRAPRIDGHWTLVIVVLALTCLMMRMAGLMTLPIFGDEAIYLRWAQLIRGDSAGVMHPWVSLADPKPPLHFWLIALFFHWARDPLMAARFISVAAGIASIPLGFGVCGELHWLMRPNASGSRAGMSRSREGALPPPTGRVLGLFFALFLIFCPFLAFYQRLATADALFAGESLAIVWLSLRWGRLVSGHYLGSWRTAVALGVAIGLALMTRQGLSYTLCAMPVIGWVWHQVNNRHEPQHALHMGRSVAQFILTAVLAAVVWSPFLTAELHERALIHIQELPVHNVDVTNPDLVQEVKRRVFYQEKFTDSGESRYDVALRNARSTFVPIVDENWTPTSGWLYFYLTPGLFVASLGGLVYLLLRRQWEVLALLLAWILLTLGPVIVLGNVVYSRYVLAGVPPLLIAGAYLVAELVGFFFWQFEHKPGIAWGATILVLAILLLWPLRELGLQSTRWWTQTLTARDQYQYVHGWTAGTGTEHAIADIKRLAKVGPVLVITGNEWGTPADAAWVYLTETPGVTVYSTDQHVIGGGRPRNAPAPSDADDLWLRPDKWLWPPYRSVRVPESVPVLYITQANWGGVPAEERLKKENPNLELWRTFNGITENGVSDPDGAVAVFVLHHGTARLPE